MKKTILLVDDASFMRTAVKSMLEEYYDVVGAASGEEALSLYLENKPDLILTDLVMPGMTGLELQKRIQEQDPDPAPIIFISADADEEIESRGLENGAMDFIRKPFKKTVLLRRVGNILRQEEKLKSLRTEAYTDPMTGLLNKARVREVLRRLCLSASGTLMMVDLDSFKPVNDLFGHAMGDQVLIRFAEILRSVVRSTDIVGRIGGDEFIVFCQDIRDEEVIRGKTARINELALAAARDLMGENMGIPLGASVGAVLVPDEGTEFAELSEKADKALYQVKQNGKHGCAFFHSVQRHTGPVEQDAVRAATLRNIQTILDERNRHPGAFELGFENFRAIYRFLIRAIENYHRPVVLLLFTLKGPGAADAAESFGRILCQSLRRSDVYTRNGASQYLVLTPENEEVNREIILERIMDNWGSPYPGVEIAWESVDLRKS